MPTEISIVIPIFNEEENLQLLLDKLFSELKKLNKTFEVICVDDHSNDESLKKLLQLRSKYPVEILHLRKHMGKGAALAAGFQSAKGDIIFILDADLQCSPEDIPAFLEAINNCDAVCGYRTGRKDNRIKLISSYIANTFRNMVTHESVRDTGCPLKAIRRECLGHLIFFDGFHRFLPTLLKIKGFRVSQIPVQHYPRKFGVSKYNISNRLWKGLADLMAVRWMQKNLIRLNKEVVRK